MMASNLSSDDVATGHLGGVSSAPMYQGNELCKYSDKSVRVVTGSSEMQCTIGFKLNKMKIQR